MTVRPELGLIGLVTALRPGPDGSLPDPLTVYSAVQNYKNSQAVPTGSGSSTGYSGSMPIGSYNGPASSAMSAYSMLQNGGLPAGFVPNDLRTVAGDTLSAPAIQSLLAGQRATGITPWQYITQGYRSYGQQVNAYQDKPGIAAAPGKSMHQLGLAMDTRNLPATLSNWLLANGWYQFNASKEPWHYSYNWVG